MSTIGMECVTMVSVKGSSEYLPRVRRIVECLADSVGMDSQEANVAEMVLSEVCADAIQRGARGGADNALSITLSASGGSIVADVADGGIGAADDPIPGLGLRLMRMISDGVQLIRHKTGLTVKLTKRIKNARRLHATQPSAHHRN